MDVIEKYRLELHWDAVEYNSDEVAVLRGAYFSGPVLKEAAKLRENDELILDMTTQHLVFIPDYYQATLNWKGIQYWGNQIFLKEAWIRGKHINSVEALADKDWLLIDCREHEEAKHPYHLVYWAEVRKAEGKEKY